MMKLDVAFAYITCIIHFIRTFGVVQMVKVMGFLQDYKIQ